jgi:hypothetical protein
MMFKLRRKMILIGMFAILALALIVGLALPAMAAGPIGGTRGTPEPNIANVQGTLAVASNVITVTATSTPAVALTAESGQMATILYNSTTGAIQGLMLNRTGQALPTPKITPKAPTNNTFGSVQGTLTAAGNIVTVTPNAATPVALNVAAGQMAAILYNKTTGAVQGLRLSRSGQPSATPKVVPNKNFTNVQGTLALSGNVITVTANSAPTVALNSASGQMVTILYNSTTGAVQGLMLNRTDYALPTPKVTPNAAPKAIPNKNFASVQGTLTVAGNVITVTANTPPVALTAASGQLVGILYSSTTGAVQGLMLNRSGQGLAAPDALPNHNGKNWNSHGFLGRSGSTGQPGISPQGTPTAK